MKTAKVFSAIFGVLGTILLVGSLALCLICRNWEPKAQTGSPEAEAAARQFLDALSQGDYGSAEAMIYGQPKLGGEESFRSEALARVWEAFRERLSFETPEPCYAEGENLYLDVTVWSLDVAGVMRSAADLAKAQSAEGETTLSSEERLLSAVEKALSSGERVSAKGRLQLMEDGDQWYVIPDKTVLSAISGGLG